MRKVGGVRRKREGMCKKIEFRGLVEERAQQQRALFPVLLAPANNSPALGPGPASAKAERLDVDAGDTGEGPVRTQIASRRTRLLARIAPVVTELDCP